MGYLSVPSPHELVQERASATILVPVMQLHAPDGDTIHQQSVTRARASEPGGLARKPETRWATSSVTVLCERAAETDGIHFPSADMITAFLPRSNAASWSTSRLRATRVVHPRHRGVTRARGAFSRGSGQPAEAPSGASECNVAASLHSNFNYASSPCGPSVSTRWMGTSIDAERVAAAGG